MQVEHLAYKVLAANVRRLAADWQAYYCQPIVLLETFVDQARFRGPVIGRRTGAMWALPRAPPGAATVTIATVSVRRCFSILSAVIFGSSSMVDLRLLPPSFEVTVEELQQTPPRVLKFLTCRLERLQALEAPCPDAAR